METSKKIQDLSAGWQALSINWQNIYKKVFHLEHLGLVSELEFKIVAIATFQAYSVKHKVDPDFCKQFIQHLIVDLDWYKDRLENKNFRETVIDKISSYLKLFDKYGNKWNSQLIENLLIDTQGSSEQNLLKLEYAPNTSHVNFATYFNDKIEFHSLMDYQLELTSGIVKAVYKGKSFSEAVNDAKKKKGFFERLFNK